MSILIKDMKMPKRCLDCPMYDCYNYYCQLYTFGIPARYYIDGNTRPEWCELVELPEKHGDLIDRDALPRDAMDFDVWNASVVIEAEGTDEGSN